MAARRRRDDVDPLDHLTLGFQPSNAMAFDTRRHRGSSLVGRKFMIAMLAFMELFRV